MSIVSQKLRDSASHHDAYCTFQIAGVCQWPGAGCVLCHIRLIGECGGGQKPDDTLAGLGCVACHDVFDGRVKGLEKNSEDWNFYAMRALARTIRFWFQHDFLTIKGAK
ncbi:MAG: nuclease domain-containing protein [Rhodanobacter sp.]